MKTKRMIAMSLLLLSLCLAACSDDDEVQNSQDTCLLVGKWVQGEGELRDVLVFRSNGTGYREYISDGKPQHIDFTYTWKEEKEFPLYEGYDTVYTVWYTDRSKGPDIFLVSKDSMMMLPVLSSRFSYYKRQ